MTDNRWGLPHRFSFFMLRVLNIPNFTIPDDFKWNKAVKVGGMFAIPLTKLFTDITVAKHFTLQTLEGPQQVKEDLILCIGTNKTDPWMQSIENILRKYLLENVTPDGWMYFIPKPGNEVLCYQVRQEDFDPGVDGFEVYAAYGEKVWPDGPDKPHKHVQSGKIGDFVCKDAQGQLYIIDKRVFETTYKLVDDNTA